MPRDKTGAHKRIIKAATAEFLEYGFEGASMRRIAENSDITAGALYKHFKNKEDMFSALVEPTINELLQIFDKMQKESLELLPKVGINEIWKDYGGDAALFMKFIYAHFCAFKLIVCCSHGTKYDTFIHDVAIMEEKSTTMFIERSKELGMQINDVPDRELHLLVTANVSAIFEAVFHDFSEADAIHYANTLDVFFSTGWKRIFGI